MLYPSWRDFQTTPVRTWMMHDIFESFLYFLILTRNKIESSGAVFVVKAPKILDARVGRFFWIIGELHDWPQPIFRIYCGEFIDTCKGSFISTCNKIRSYTPDIDWRTIVYKAFDYLFIELIRYNYFCIHKASFI